MGEGQALRLGFRRQGIRAFRHLFPTPTRLRAHLASVLIALAGLHGLVAIVMTRLERVNLVGALITGVKRRRCDQPGMR